MFFTGAFLKELPFHQHPSLVFIGNNSFQENSCSEILSLKFFLISPTENPPRNGAITLFSEPPVRGIIGIGQTQKFPHKATQENQRFPCRSPNRSTKQIHDLQHDSPLYADSSYVLPNTFQTAKPSTNITC